MIFWTNVEADARCLQAANLQVGHGNTAAMKKIFGIYVLLQISFLSHSQQSIRLATADGDLPSHSMTVVATVENIGTEIMTIKVEHVVTSTNGIGILPDEGDEISVKVSEDNSPSVDSRIEVDLKEKIDVGAQPTSYIMLGFRTIE